MIGHGFVRLLAQGFAGVTPGCAVRVRAAVLTCVLGAGALSACDRPSRTGGADSVGATSGSGVSGGATDTLAESGWDDAAGPFIVLPTVDGGLVSGSLLRPEATEMTVGDTSGVGRVLGDRQVELFSRSGSVGMARLTIEAAPRVDDGCTAWPVARLAANGTMPPWTAAFAAKRVTAVALDSIEGLAGRDSALFAARLTRLASALKDDTSATFRGLPFVVLRAWRTKAGPDGFVVATLVRRVNQEDDPREERLVLVVDTPSDADATWSVGWHERAAGREEELVVAEPLLAFHLAGRADLHLLFGRDDGVALGAAVLVRVNGAWRVQWESAVAGCN